MPHLKACSGCGQLFTPTRAANGRIASRCPDCSTTYEREKSRARRARKGTTAERGYDATHERLRRIAIAQHPYCANCGTTEDLTADHITPLAAGGVNTLANYQV